MAVKGDSSNNPSIKPVLVIIGIALVIIAIGYGLKLFQEKQLRTFQEHNQKNQGIYQELYEMQKSQYDTIMQQFESAQEFDGIIESGLKEDSSTVYDETVQKQENTDILPQKTLVKSILPIKDYAYEKSELPSAIRITATKELDISSDVQLHYEGEDVSITTPFLSSDRLSIFLPLDPNLSFGQYVVVYTLCVNKFECETYKYQFEVK